MKLHVLRLVDLTTETRRHGDLPGKGKQLFSFFLLTFLSLWLCASMAFPQSTGRTEIETLSLSQIEGLKGENLQLKLDSADKQMRLLQEQYARLAELQAALVRQLQELERELLAARGLSPAD